MATEKNLKKLTIHKLKKKTYNALAEKPVDELVMLTDVGGQVAEITEASADYVGEIVQYVGETNDTYTNGYFYKCIENDGVYSWVKVNVQEGGADLPDNIVLNNGTSLYGDEAIAIGTDSVAHDSSVSIGTRAKTASNGVSIGRDSDASSNQAVAIGMLSKSTGNASIAIGPYAAVTANYAIQLGGTSSMVANTESNTLKVCLGWKPEQNCTLLTSDCTIPTDRYTATPTTAGTYVPKLTIAEDGTATREWGTASSGGVGGDFLPTTGGTLTGALQVEGISPSTFDSATILTLVSKSDDGEIYGSYTLGATAEGFSFFGNHLLNCGIILPKLRGQTKLGNEGAKWKAVYTLALNNGEDLVVPTKGGTLARLEDLEGIGGGASLPDQTGNAGKFLTTDGTTASWGNSLKIDVSTIYPTVHIGSITTGYCRIAIGKSVSGASYGAVIGNIAIGDYSGATSPYATAIGNYAVSKGERAIQIGQGTNTDADTFKVGNLNGNFEMMDANGNVPRERLKNLVEVLPTADNDYTTVKNFGNNYIEATGIYEVGSVEANAEVVEVITFPEGVQFEEGQMYWANAHATTEDTNGNTVVANVISRGSSDITIVYKNLGSTDVENLTICWEVRGVVVPK